MHPNGIGVVSIKSVLFHCISMMPVVWSLLYKKKKSSKPIDVNNSLATQIISCC